MKTTVYRLRQQFLVLVVILGCLGTAPVVHGAAPAADSAIRPDVGDWVGMAWGWEIRFKSSQIGGVTGNKNVMTLTVKHLARLDFTVDKAGNIVGNGQITYDLDPNLCGVARLTEQVNEAINLMAQLPDFEKQGANIAKKATEYFDATSFVEESALESQIKQWEDFGSSPRPVLNEPWVNPANYKANDVTDLAKSVWEDRCTTGAPVVLVGGLTCDDLRKGPFGKEFQNMLGHEAPEDFWDKAAEWIYDQAKDKVKEKVKEGLKEKVKETFKLFDQKEAQEKSACEGSSTLRAGTQVNVPGVGGLGRLGLGALGTMAQGGMPTGALMSIPGVTQVSYQYKGLANGPESRRFKIKGNIRGDKMYLHMDGDVYEGDKDLVVEYMVNFRREQRKFPTWSPFIDDEGGDAHQNGNLRVLERKVVKDKSNVPHEVTIAKESYMSTPFAIFHKTGEHRGGVKPWQEYEYYWYAHQVTKPKSLTGKM